MQQRPIPVTLLTGFLGSGKTTLLNQLLANQEGLQAAVLINEFGEVGLDHLLARPVQGTKVIIKNGCICCTVHQELSENLTALLKARDKGEIPYFDRLLIETSGASEPMPIVMTLQSDPMFCYHFRLENIVVTVDSLTGIEQLNQRITAVRQVAMADHIVMTKTDLQENPQILTTLQQRVHKLSPEAAIHYAPITQNLWTNLMTSPKVRCKIQKNKSQSHKIHAVSLHQDDTGLNSFSVIFEHKPDWSRFAVWLSLLIHRYGRQILRIKGLLAVKDSECPMLLNVVQHFIHPPQHLDQWPDEDHRSRLVFITDGIDANAIRQALQKILSNPNL